uniref:Uncharacterized protein n=1 Tax=Anopheles culicifacies TaxID=139723 RepID=A0A182M5L5_9DIPT
MSTFTRTRACVSLSGASGHGPGLRNAGVDPFSPPPGRYANDASEHTRILTLLLRVLAMGKIENQAELVPKGFNKNWNQFRKVGAIEPSGTVRNRPEPSEIVGTVWNHRNRRNRRKPYEQKH